MENLNFNEMTQLEMVEEHLKRFGSITQLEAFNEYAIFRLSAIIYTLRKLGYKIVSETLTRKNRFGKLTNFAKYTLKED